MSRCILRQFLYLGAVLSLILGVVDSAIIIPKPSGPYDVGSSILKLVDSSRTDPYQPNNQPRSVLISAFYPAAKTGASSICPVPYLSSFTASFYDEIYGFLGIPNGTFEQLQVQLACNPNPESKCISSTQDFPVVLFSPGAGVTRLFYSAIAQYISSNGFIVVTIDHPGDADIVEFPDGKVVYSALGNATEEDYVKATFLRAGDVRFILDSISKASVAKKLIPGSRKGLDVRKTVMYGHSLGGATAALAAYQDKRLVGAADLDGMLLGPVATNGLGKSTALLLWEAPSHNQSNDATLGQILQNSRGWKRELRLEKSEHLSFSDVPLLAYLFGIQDSEVMKEVIGEVLGPRVLGILVPYLTAFIELALGKKNQPLLKAPSSAYPEVVFLT